MRQRLEDRSQQVGQEDIAKVGSDWLKELFCAKKMCTDSRSHNTFLPFSCKNKWRKQVSSIIQRHWKMGVPFSQFTNTPRAKTKTIKIPFRPWLLLIVNGMMNGEKYVIYSKAWKNEGCIIYEVVFGRK